MRTHTLAATFRHRILGCLLCYALLASLCAPFGNARRNASHRHPSAASTAKASTRQSNAPRRAGELVVRFREEVPEELRNSLISSRGGRRRAKLRGEGRFEKVEAQVGQDAQALAESLRADPNVELAEPNFLITPSQTTPDDERFSEQWALRNTGQGGGQAGADVGAAQAWRATTGSPSAVIAIVDSGVDFSHPDLRNQRWTNRRERDDGRDNDRDGFTDDLHGWDWVTVSGAARDEQGHGTAVAGLIAAEGNNRVGVSGVMWRASLMSLRVLDATGTGDVAAAAEAIDYAAAHGARVINCSWGTEAESLVLRDAIERAGRRGVLVVASAGNGGQDLDAAPYYPASFDLPNLVSVASTDRSDQLAPFSNHGASHVAVAAPGVDLLTTKMGGGYQLVSGTSASAPLVTGIAGLLVTADGSVGAAAVRTVIVEGARRVSALARLVSSGGVVNAHGALEALAQFDPYRRPRGNGNGNGGRQGGSGEQDWRDRPATPSQRGHGRRFDVPPPAPTRDAPDGLPDLDVARRQPSHVPAAPPTTIRSNLAPICTDCYEVGGSDPEFSDARSLPENETGQPGDDSGSQNFNWSLPLVSLPGRAGLDLNLTLFYNSLVWIKQGSTIQYNADDGFPGPGFRLALPVIQKQFVDTGSGRNAYMLVTPSGSRVKLVQVNLSDPNEYESNDGGYTRFNAATNLLRTNDGTQYTFYTLPNTERRCTQIKDRNGNYITISYNAAHNIGSVTDTLGRVVTFNYDAYGNLSTLTQARAGMVSTLATFIHTPTTVQPSFASSSITTVSGPTNNVVSLLTRVRLPDDSRYDFAYTNFGQVYKITHFAPDGTELAYTGYTLPGSPWVASSPQSDCPRYTERRDWITQGVMVADAEVVTKFSVDPSGQGAWSQVTLPDDTPQNPNDNLVVKEYFATSGWQRGLTTRTEYFLAGSPQTLLKYTTTVWTQDDTTLSYQKNPRPSEVNVYDEANNRRRTTFEYTSYSLPATVREWGGADGLTLLRKTTTGYRWDAAYLERRIVGLVDSVEVRDGPTDALVSKTTYGYDWDGWGGDMFQDVPGGVQVTQHDRAAYGPSFVYGRGNRNQVARWDVSDPTNTAKTQETKRRFNITGSVLMVRDHDWHPVYFDYGDNFSTAGHPLTFAYPTTVTDPDGFQSTTKYVYATGAVSESHRPSAGTSQLNNVVYETTVISYDTLARLDRVTTQNNGAYARYVYSADGLNVQTFSTVTAGAGEGYSVRVFDGAGRMRAAAWLLPGSAGGYAGQHFFYDSRGRVVQTSKPAEMTGAWVLAGDDASSNWVWTTQTYDWMDRPLVTANPGSTTREVTYAGCGCAGGAVQTVRDEAGRRRKLYHDTLGRMTKVEELNFDENVYSTTTYAYNARDQLTQISRQGQTRTLEYDGHGRLSRRTTPEQGATEYSYNADDTLAWAKDARGAKTVYGYAGTGRHRPTSIAYDLSGVLSGQSVAATPGVTFSYDAAGNRTQMSDGLGTVKYSYDSLSRLSWEEREFGDLPGQQFRLTYGYDLAGQLTSFTNHRNSLVTYTRDVMGRATGVTGSGEWSAPTYAQGLSYRAWGGLKSETYGNGRLLSVGYNARMLPTSWQVAGVLGSDYSYRHFGENTGRVTFAKNLVSNGAADSRLDRSYEYDQAGRLLKAYTGTNARAHTGQGGSWGQTDGPYTHNFSYDVWGNQTQQGAYTNNRRDAFAYDASGNVTADGTQSFVYDADGRQVAATYAGYELTQGYDGNRLRVKKTENDQPGYFLRSSVLGGQVVAELGAAGGWERGYVYGPAGGQLALQKAGSVYWVHQDPITKSKRLTDSSGAVVSTVEVTPYGDDTGAFSNNRWVQRRMYTSYERDGNLSDEAGHRRYNRFYARFDQPDPSDGSYNLLNPQSFNRYAYTSNDPVNYVDPLGLEEDAVSDGFAGALQAVQSPMCRSLFKGANPEATIESFRNSPKLKVVPLLRKGQPAPNVGASTNIEEGRIAINSQGPFFTMQMPVTLVIENTVQMRSIFDLTPWRGLTPTEVRAVILLHEILHVLDVIPRDGPRVDPTGEISKRTTERIIFLCVLARRWREAPVSTTETPIGRVIEPRPLLRPNGSPMGGLGPGNFGGWTSLDILGLIFASPTGIVTVGDFVPQKYGH